MQDLVERRNACAICMQLTPGRIHNGSSEKFKDITGGREHFSYWSQWLGDTDPNVLIVGQDFGGTEYIYSKGFEDKPGNQTNEELRRLLGIAGIHVTVAPTTDRSSGVFLTNSVLCIKEGHLAAPIRKRWINACSDTMLGPLISELKPRIVVALGAAAWSAVSRYYGLQGRGSRLSLTQALRLERFWGMEGGPVVFCVGHCSVLGRHTRKKEDQERDWKRIGAVMSKMDLKPRTGS